mgnify:CR=1 FL=1
MPLILAKSSRPQAWSLVRCMMGLTKLSVKSLMKGGKKLFTKLNTEQAFELLLKNLLTMSFKLYYIIQRAALILRLEPRPQWYFLCCFCSAAGFAKNRDGWLTVGERFD